MPEEGCELKMKESLIQHNLQELSVSHSEENTNSLCAPQRDQLNRPSFRGPYSPVRNGTIRGSIFALLASVLGTGNLNLPLRISHIGLLPFIIILVMTACLSYLGMYLMSKFMVKFKVVSYSEMVRRSFGRRIMRMAESVLIFYPWAVTISHQVILSKFIMQILYDQLGLPLYVDRERDQYNWTGHVVRVLAAVLVVFFNRGNFFNRDLREMLHSLGKFSVSGVVFNMTVIVAVAFTGFTKVYKGQPVRYQGILTMSYEGVEWGKEWSQKYCSVLLQAISGIFYTFLNPQFIFPLISHLKSPTLHRVNYIFKMAHIEQVVIYLAIAISGYLLLSQHSDIFPIAPLIITSINILPLILGKLALIGAQFLTLPLHVFTAREYLYQALDLERNDINQKRITYSLVGSSLALSICFQQITAYYGLIGGVSGILIACVIPMCCTLKMLRPKKKDRRIMIFVGVVSLLAFVGGFLSVLDPV